MQDILNKYNDDSFKEVFGDFEEVNALFDVRNETPTNIPDNYKKPKEEVSALLDIPRQMYYGYIDAVSSMADLIAEPIAESLTGKEIEGSITKQTGAVPETKEPQTIAGSIVRPLTQAGVGIGVAGGASKFVGLAKTAEGSTLLTKLAPFFKGFTGDFIAFDEHEKNLTETLNDIGLKDNTIVKIANEFFAKDDEDGFLEARLKNALEGAFIGAGADSILKTFKYIKDGRISKDLVSTSKKAINTTKEMIQKSTKEIERGYKGLKIAQASREIGKVDKTFIDIANKETVGKPLEQTIQEAEEKITKEYASSIYDLGIDSKEITNTFHKIKKSEDYKYINALALKEQQIFENVIDVSKKAVDTFEGTLDEGLVDDALGALYESLLFRTKSIDASSEIARSLNLRSKLPAITHINQISKLMKNGDLASKYKILDAVTKMTDVKQLDALGQSLEEVAKKGKLRLGYDLAVYLWQNSLLSSAKTFASDFISTALWQGYNVAETLSGATIGAFRRGVFGRHKTKFDAVTFSEAYNLFGTYLSTIKDGLVTLGKGTRQSVQNKDLSYLKDNLKDYWVKTSKDVGDRFGGDVDLEFLSADAWGISKESAFGKTLEFLNKTKDKHPLHLMGVKDDFIAGIRYSAEKNRMAVRLASSKKLTGEAFDNEVMKLKSSIEKASEFKDEDEFVKFVNENSDIAREEALTIWGASNKAFAETQRAVFRDDLGKTGTKIQELINTAPAGKIIVPFFKTPTKLLWDRYLMERGPLAPFALLSKDTVVGKMWRAGGADRDMVTGQLALAGSLHLIGWQMAMSGKITGELPKNKAERDLLLSSGIKENSIKVGNEWIDISRYSPIADMFITPANIIAVMDRHEDKFGVKEENTITEYLLSSVSGTATTFLNKTWTQNLSQFIDIWTSENPDRMKTYLDGLGASIVPAFAGDISTSLDSLAEAFGDDYVKYQQHRNGLWESIKVRAGADTRPALDVFGEPIKAPEMWYGFLPSKITEETDDPVIKEMLRIGAYISKPDYRLQGVQLEPLERYRYLEIMGNMNVKGLIGSAMSTSAYANLPESADIPNMTTKAEYIKTIYGKVKKRASEILIEETPELKERIYNYKMNLATKSAIKPTTQRLLPQIRTGGF